MAVKRGNFLNTRERRGDSCEAVGGVQMQRVHSASAGVFPGLGNSLFTRQSMPLLDQRVLPLH